MTGPFYWACAQSQYGTRPRACVGLGSLRRMIGTGPGACMGPRSWYRTIYIYIYILRGWGLGEVRGAIAPSGPPLASPLAAQRHK